MTFGVGASTHRPKYRLWLGLYIITLIIFAKIQSRIQLYNDY